MRWYAAEESAKVLILLDAVRCPRNPIEISRTLKYCYDHVVKGIYVKVCEWRPNNFAEICKHIEYERMDYYLDGPNDIDWISPNAITRDRERTIYVDYVRDITEDHGECFWIRPSSIDVDGQEYDQPDAFTLTSTLHRVGITSPESLEIIAEIWRTFVPNENTDVHEVINLVQTTLENLDEKDLISNVDSATESLINMWPFPLWSLDLSAKRVSRENLRTYRSYRSSVIKSITEMEAMKEPKPVISKEKVVQLSRLHKVYQERTQSIHEYYLKENPTKFGIPASLEGDRCSFEALKSALIGLTEQERVDLLALAWFTRDRIANWPATYEYASRRINGLSLSYQACLGGDWLDGFERLERDPVKFYPGRMQKV